MNGHEQMDMNKWTDNTVSRVAFITEKHYNSLIIFLTCNWHKIIYLKSWQDIIHYAKIIFNKIYA